MRQVEDSNAVLTAPLAVSGTFGGCSGLLEAKLSTRLIKEPAASNTSLTAGDDHGASVLVGEGRARPARWMRRLICVNSSRKYPGVGKHHE
jgi:hypothetical protein